MGEKLVVGPINKGLRNDVTAFNIDNDSFPILINAYQWRGRVKRKRGTSLLSRLTRYFNSAIPSYGIITSFTLSGGAGNLLTAFGLTTKSPNASIVPGSVSFVDSTASNTYTDPSANGILVGAPSGTGTINYASGGITVTGGASDTIMTVSFSYYPTLPVMGIEDFVITSSQFPGTIDFDTVYSYRTLNTVPYNTYDVSFYKNPPSATYTNYVQKTNINPVTWNGQSYQQFWTVNFQGALWATNGFTTPFSVTNIGMQYKPIVAVTVLSGTTANLQITAHGLVIGDFVFVNEVVSTTGINFQTGYVTTVSDANNVIVTFPNASIATDGTGGIAQYLTNRSDTTKDCIRWYDGDPTDGNATTPTLNGRKGWVNFCPPLCQFPYSIAGLPAQQYYLVGARAILPFKNRLLFFGAVIQTSTAGSQVYLPDTVIYSQDGTPFYTASYTNVPSATVDTPTNPLIDFEPILVPDNQTATSPAYFEDQNGFGGFAQVGLDQAITTVATNEDVIIVGLNTIQSKMVFTGNDIQPFLFYTVNSELGSASTFSSINMDRGVLSVGSRGIIITNQVSAARIDLEIPDEIFEFRLSDNGFQRIAAQRDYINEWAYFTYPVNTSKYIFPTQTLQYNYRDESWGIFKETYTTYGLFRKVTGYTWGTIGTVFPTWSVWNEPWSAGSSTLLQPQVLAGNQQGFLLIRDEGTGEGNSIAIQNITGTTVTSTNHCLNNGDYIVISGVLGTIAENVNGLIFSVQNPTANTFTLNPNVVTGTYLGGGLIKRMYVPQIQTKQFPISWGMARKTRIGPQQYLFTRTPNAQITLQIFLSQNANDPYNSDFVVPDATPNSSLIYTNVLYTCPESINLGLTPANVNLNTPTAGAQAQIWHRMNTSLIGDTVQIGFTLSEEQMRNIDFDNQFSEIELHSLILDVTPSQLLV